MPVGVNDIIKIAVHFLIDGLDENLNIHTLRVDDTGGASDDGAFMAALSDLLLDELYSIVQGDMADNVVGTLLTGLNLTDSEILPPTIFICTGTNNTADSLARQVTGLVYLNTGFPHRQGRCYLPPFAENNLDDDGQWGSTTQTHLSNFGLALLDPLTDGSMVVQRVVCHPDGSSPVVPTYAGISLSPRTQRRRTPGRGS